MSAAALLAPGVAGSDPTVIEELSSLRRRGFHADFSVTPAGLLRCGACGEAHQPSEAVIESTARFEGASNPDDQAVVFGLHSEACGRLGVLVTAYGPTATAAEGAVISALVPRRWGGREV
jgi:hypothetical protein